MLIKESLVAREQWGPFYQMLIARSTGLTSYDRDYAYTAQLEKSWSAAGAEEALDHETNYKRSEPDSRKTSWQKDYLGYLIERRGHSEARKLMAVIEAAVYHRYARPVWLRLAALRLDIREGRVASAYDSLVRLAGVATKPNMTAIKPPSVDRLNDVAQLLRDEGRTSEATTFVEAAYAREIALEQYQPAYFAGLADIAFQRGDSAAGLMWLQSMVRLSREDTKAETQRQLSSLPLVKKYSVEAQEVELPGASNGIAEAKALGVAAETAAQFLQFEAATNYRRLLLTVSPADEENRIELVRLLDASKQTDEAIESLAAILADRNATRYLRWQAVWLAPEITKQQDGWNALRDRVRSLNPNDHEMAAALEAMALAASDRTVEGLKLLVSVESKNPNPSLRTLQASFEEKAGHEADALNSWLLALTEGRDSSAWEPFAFVADEPLDQVIRLYLKQRQPRAALKMAERLGSLQVQTTTVMRDDKKAGSPRMNDGDPDGCRYRTLRGRAELRKREARAGLLSLLSVAAVDIGDLNRAMRT